MRVAVAIPGQPTRFALPPAGEVERALAAVTAASKAAARRELFGYLNPPAFAATQDSQADHPVLRVLCAASVTCRGRYQLPIVWRWGLLWEHKDWHEMGWHPCANYAALLPGWQDALQRALNPGRHKWT